MLDTTALWISGTVFTVLTCVGSIAVRRDAQSPWSTPVSRAGGAVTVVAFGALALLTMAAAVL